MATRKQAAKEFVKLWCAATTGGERAVFESQWESGNHLQSYESPSKKRRDSFGDAPSAEKLIRSRGLQAAVADDNHTETNS